ncbi:hypothetical protein [Chryseobacterium wangxinyae]|uniref:hypothetical protein n=1 Tax=Chryseobacterium sp. CY353 TaxID=2997334 RepID=UPI00226E131E|nr:hypothetical protein [Chryseobacterium sp. CY353]MCY0968211.1 hypothetical protein [Chryseobacterium sp. CY353]
MKVFVFKIVFAVILVVTLKISAQQKVYSKNDIGKFKENEKFYLNKNVKNVLRDLKINFETASFGGCGSEEMCFIVLRFDARKDYFKLIKNGIKPARLMIFIKEHDQKTNKLFSPDKNRLEIERNHLKNNSNIRILKDYKKFIVAMIYANSEQQETKKE